MTSVSLAQLNMTLLEKFYLRFVPLDETHIAERCVPSDFVFVLEEVVQVLARGDSLHAVCGLERIGHNAWNDYGI